MRKMTKKMKKNEKNCTQIKIDFTFSYPDKIIIFMILFYR